MIPPYQRRPIGYGATGAPRSESAFCICSVFSRAATSNKCQDLREASYEAALGGSDLDSDDG